MCCVCVNPEMTSGEHWQIVLHGGRGGDVLMQVKRTRKLVAPHKREGMTAGEEQ